MESVRRGVIFGLLAGALWGLSYILPVFVPQASAIEVTIGRYLAYGCFSLILLLLQGRQTIASIPMRIWKVAFVYAITGNVAYYALEVMGIRTVGAPVVALLFSMMPIGVSVFGNFMRREFPFSLLWTPLLVIFSGVMSLNWAEVHIAEEITSVQFALGIFVTLLSIAMWAWYAVHNADFLRNEVLVTPAQMSSLVGVCCLFIALGVLGGVEVLCPDQLTFFHAGESDGWILFVVVSLILGIIVSWLATDLWNRASKMLPVSLAGQLVVSEIVCGLTYCYVYEWALPSVMEGVGISLVLLGVWISVRRIEQYRWTLQNSAIAA